MNRTTATAHSCTYWRAGAKAAWVALSLAALSGCDGQGTPNRTLADAVSTTVDTLGGVVRIVNAGNAPEWTLRLVTSIGPSEVLGSGQAPNEFGRASSVALDPTGEAVYVADQLNCEIRVFGLDGAHLRTIGRCGEGPGEFSPFFYSIAWVGDRLLSFDLGAGRIGEISAEGEWLGSRRTVAAMGASSEIRFYPTALNQVYATEFLPGRRLGRQWVGHSAEGETGDTIAVLPPEGNRVVLCEWGEGMISSFEIPYGSRRLQHPGPNGLGYSATTDEYRIFVTRGSDTVRVIERVLPKEEVSDAEWNAVEEEWDQWVAERPGASCDPRRPIRPAAKPVVADIFWDMGGRMLVEVARSDGNYWEAFDADGVLVGRLAAPRRREGIGTSSPVPPAFGGGLVATIRRDSLDLDHVDVFRIEG